MADQHAQTDTEKVGLWSRSGLLAGACAGAKELRRRGMNRVIFEVPRYGVTVVFARGERAAELRAWFAARSDTGAPS